MFGILQKSWQLLLKTLSEFEEIEKVVIYGSRAMGNHKPGSDIDLAIYGNRISQETVLRLKTKLDQELPIPYYFDLIHYETISNPELRSHINKFGKIIYPC